MDNELTDFQKFLAVGVGEFLFCVVVVSLGYWLGFPGNGVFVVVLILLSLLVLAAWYEVRQRDSIPGFQTTQKSQLTDEEARELAHYIVVYREGYRTGRIQSGIEPAVSSSDDKEDAVRLFKFEFEPLNRSGRATLYLDLEQDLSVNIGDVESLEDASVQVQNKMLVKSWMCKDYERACKEAKESLGRSVDPTVTVTRTEDGTEIVERPARIQNQSTSSSDSAGAES